MNVTCKIAVSQHRAATSLSARDSLILQDPDHDSTVLRLTLSFLVAAYLPAFTHSPGRQHIGERNVALLLKKLGNTVGPILA